MATFKMQLVLTVLLITLVAEFSVLACDIETARQSESMPGGWSSASVDDDSVVQLKQSAANDASVAKTHHVVEAYQQVVAGVNYCIRFSASANCSTHYCQAVECVAGGHRPLPVNGQQQPIQSQSLSCTAKRSCNIAEVRDNAKEQLPGGWHAQNTTHEYVEQLYNHATAIANVRSGAIQEAYTQVVARLNLCIQFDSTGSANCHQQCQALSCVASGFLPLAHNTNNPGVVSGIGITCQPGGTLPGYEGSSTGTTTSLAAASLVTSIVLLVLVRVLGSAQN